ncbi:MAG: hypothetical protein HY893_04115 [Deltaproteobacteria bacterium]|nr:hypothetical protein [Deltaproteobacteria bacterium]
MRIISVIVLMALLLSTGCASIIAGKNQLIGINSNPDSAQILIKDEYGQVVFKGTTPTSVLLQKGDGYFHGKDYTVEIAKDGYSKQIVTIKSGPGGWYLLGNIVFGGLIGWFIVDPLTGAMWTLSPDKVNAELSKNPSTGKLNPNDLYIVLLDDVPANLRDQMVRVK